MLGFEGLIGVILPTFIWSHQMPSYSVAEAKIRCKYVITTFELKQPLTATHLKRADTQTLRQGMTLLPELRLCSFTKTEDLNAACCVMTNTKQDVDESANSALTNGRPRFFGEDGLDLN